MRQHICICLLLLGWLSGDLGYASNIFKMRFQAGGLDIETEYQDPTSIDRRLRGLLPYNFVVKNTTDSTISFNQNEIALDIGVGQLLRPVQIDSVIWIIQQTDGKLPPILNELGSILRSQSTTFNPNYRHRVADYLKDHRLRDGEIKPGKKKEGWVFFLIPEGIKPSNWTHMEFAHYPPQALQTKSYDVYNRPEEIKGWTSRFNEYLKKWEKIYGKYFKGDFPAFDISYALLVGMGDYKYLDRLDWVARDIQKMKRFLKDQGFDNIITVMDSAVTQEKLENPQSFFKKIVGPDDRFLFYYSGHGTNNEEETRGYLPLTEERPKSYAHSIAMDDLVQWMDGLKAKQKLIILDCCFSGLAVKGEEIKDPLYPHESSRIALPMIAAHPARYLLMAGRKNERSFAAPKWDGSLFTEGIIRGISTSEEADNPKDGVISVRELHIWLREYVAEEARTRNRSLNPLLKDLGEYHTSEGEFFFIRK